MSRIERLGGYKNAKEAYEFLNSSRWHRTPEPDIEALGVELLEYRRANNIFEVEDYVIDEQHTGLLRVTRVMKKRLDVDYLNPQTLDAICRHSILIRHIKHATDEEIAAGYRGAK